jgi:hypothetical protein
MRQARRRPHFSLEALHGARPVHQGRVGDLQGHVAVHQLVPGLVDSPHAARAEQLLDFVARMIGQRPRRRRIDCGWVGCADEAFERVAGYGLQFVATLRAAFEMGLDEPRSGLVVELAQAKRTELIQVRMRLE